MCSAVLFEGEMDFPSSKQTAEVDAIGGRLWTGAWQELFAAGSLLGETAFGFPICTNG